MLMVQLQRYQEKNTLLEHKLSETEKTVIFLNSQVEVAKKTKETLKNQLEGKYTQLSTNLHNFMIQIEEDKKIEEVLNNQLKEKEEICEAKELEIVSLREEVKRTFAKNLKFENISSALEDILNQQRYSSDKTDIVYDHKQKQIEEEKSFKLPRSIEERPKRHTNGSKDSYSILKYHDKSRHVKQESQRPPFQIRPFAPKYQSLFPSYCFSCNNFGHKAIECISYAINTPIRNRGIYNNVECYKFQNYGHIARTVEA
jgi:hypothetical protein